MLCRKPSGPGTGSPTTTAEGGTNTVFETAASTFSKSTFTALSITPASTASSADYSATPSSTSTASSPTNTASGAGGGRYSTSDKIALGTGIGIGLPATLTSMITLYLKFIK